MNYFELDGVALTTADIDALRKKQFEERRHAWFTAKNMIEPLVDQHGLENLRSGPVQMFSAGGIISKAEQHSDLITDLADWLMGEGG